MKKNIKLKNIYKTNKKKIFIILGTALLVCLTSYFTYTVTYEKIYSTVNIKADAFYGTYLVPGSNTEEYISILDNTGALLEGGSSYVNYNTSRSLLVTGTYNKTNKNYMTLYNKNKDVFATIVYLNKNFYLLREGEEILKIKKISSEAITPY